MENTIQDNIIQSENNNKDDNENNEDIGSQEFNWYIEIPAIYLKAPVNESTHMDVLSNYVGHFEETTKTIGNIGLAGHNRGYKNNYFENLNKLKRGDEIKYKYNDFEKSYIVENIEIINSTNWNYLENTTENKLTLITCLENKPDERLCVQAIEKDESIQVDNQAFNE